MAVGKKNVALSKKKKKVNVMKYAKNISLKKNLGWVFSVLYRVEVII